MNLESIPEPVWNALAMTALKAGGGETTYRQVRGRFYKQIYEKWSEGKVSYTPNVPNRSDAAWNPFAKLMQSIQGRPSYSKALKDTSVGRVYFQQKDGDENHLVTRLGESYNHTFPVSRCQFVVSSGGGIVLFNRMRWACQTYIEEHCAGEVEHCVVNDWKIFGEGAGVGRSDNCVIYLGRRFENRLVELFINDYLWPNIRHLVTDQFQPLGLHRVGEKPLWAINLPLPAVEQKVLGTTPSRGSAGGLMGSILGRAFAAAQKSLAGKAPVKPGSMSEKDKPAGVKELVECAKQEADTLVEKLGI